MEMVDLQPGDLIQHCLSEEFFLLLDCPVKDAHGDLCGWAWAFSLWNGQKEQIVFNKRVEPAYRFLQRVEL